MTLRLPPHDIRPDTRSTHRSCHNRLPLTSRCCSCTRHWPGGHKPNTPLANRKKKSGITLRFPENEPKDHESGSPHIFTLSILKQKNNWGASRGIPAMLKLGLISRRALKVLTCPLTTLLIAAPREFTLRMSWHPSLRHESLALFDSVRMDSPFLGEQAVLVEKHQWNILKTLETNRE